MKYCPQCHMELPDTAHFCPRCTYEYPKQEIQVPVYKAICRKQKMVVLLCAMITGFGVVLLWKSFKEDLSAHQKNTVENDSHALEDFQKVIDENFRTGEDIPYNSFIVYELRNVLSDYESVSTIFDIEPQTAYEDLDYQYYQFGPAVLYIKDDKVKQVYIDYSNADDTERTQYGIWGFNGFTTREEVHEIMGDPDNYGEPQWIYYFDGVFEMPILSITFDEKDNVKELCFYLAMDLD